MAGVLKNPLPLSVVFSSKQSKVSEMVKVDKEITKRLTVRDKLMDNGYLDSKRSPPCKWPHVLRNNCGKVYIHCI
jgi:hypothetical protein